jgi:glycosyltransferase involved in cell wall biosynthesis
VVGFTGILRPWHGVDLLIRAFAELSVEYPDLHLLIVGDGPIQGQLERVALESGVRERVTFTGRVPYHEVGEHVAAMHIAVSPRATFYASPMKILEYMAMGKALVAPRMPNIEDVVEHGRTGLLFEAERVGALSAAIRDLVNDAPLRRDLGLRARRMIETRHNWLSNAQEAARRAEQIICGDASDSRAHAESARGGVPARYGPRHVS